jgi:hypothetical protein
MIVREAVARDAECLALLLRGYLDEGFPGHAGSTADELRRDVLNPTGRQHVLLVERHGTAIGFLAWDEVYDMHWAMRGAQVGPCVSASRGASGSLGTRAASPAPVVGLERRTMTA